MKPKDPIWNFFDVTEDGENLKTTCKECKAEVSAKVLRLKAHREKCSSLIPAASIKTPLDTCPTMAKLPKFHGQPGQVDVVKLLHDEVVSLCQKNYSSVSGIEIDGIICISILDTKEQQVVKIHKTLKSVFADNPLSSYTKKSHGNSPSIWLQSNAGQTGRVNTSCEKNSENYSEDIDALSNLLRDTNAAINEEEKLKDSGEDGVSGRKNRRKRKHPQQRNIRDVNINDAHSENNAGDIDKERHDIRTGADNSLQCDVTSVKPFSTVTVKEEKIDPEYEQSESTPLKIVSVSSMPPDTGLSIDSSNMSQSVTKVASLIEKLIDKEIHTPTKLPTSETLSSTSTPYGAESVAPSEHIVNSETADEALINDTEADTGYKEVIVKVEKTNDYDEYGEGVVNETSGGIHAGVRDTYSDSNDGTAYPMYPDTSSMSDGNDDRAENMYASEHEQRDPSGKSWIEMVKDNVSKYQAALMRGTKSKKKVGPMISQSRVPELQTSGLAKKSSGLVALLTKPSTSLPLPNTSNVLLNAHSEMARQSRGSSVPSQGANMNTDRSSSLSPVVKIEVDEEMNYDPHSQSDGEISSHRNNKNETASTSNEKLVNQGPGVRHGKLESRYPALFSHLQAKKVNYFEQDQTDSLVNRLPFISFQELFSHSSTGTTLPQMNEATTIELLAKARVKPFSARERKPCAKKKVWNWKKRQIRPKDSNGRIISPLPSRTYSDADGGEYYTPGKRTNSKKLKNDNDTEWTPESSQVDIDSNDAGVMDDAVNNEISTPSRRTRLSSGKKPRINFAELENSDLEMEEEYEEEGGTLENKGGAMEKRGGAYHEDDDDDIKIIKLESNEKHYNPSHSMNNLYVGSPMEQTDSSNNNTGNNSNIYTGSANSNFAIESTSSGINNNNRPEGGTGSSACKCTICGLEFNQEYRWHYHMIKVHGVASDNVQLFR